ncbi:MAG TPA: hypothetical protein DCZ91_21630 [Lachnospiraceae bacterium]|nr:hypothetical protein [Lachnospiraceae bacterium]
MLNIEYVRSLNSNYERIQLDKIPEERKYQYCILGRCQIKGLLPCSLRYINGGAYLYYNITSKQNLARLFGNRNITREWVRDFIWSLKQVQQELGRFLLDMNHILWHPEQIFQDLEDHVFFFLYVPYYEGGSDFLKLMEFWVEHIDYNDETLVDCVYRMYERLERNGEVYLHSQIFEDAECLEKVKMPDLVCTVLEEKVLEEEEPAAMVASDVNTSESGTSEKQTREGKKGIFGILEGKRNRNRKIREEYKVAMQQSMTGLCVAEENFYEKSAEEKKSYGKTVYIEERPELEERTHRLLTTDGRLLASLDTPILSIGKKKGEVDLVLEEASVSRMHARITNADGRFYLEDLNSTNGTFRNGLQMQPYEKKKLEEGDEIKCGKAVFIFR